MFNAMATTKYYVYILTNKTRGLYTGMTGELHRRMTEHKHGLVPGFTKKYRMTRLVYCHAFPTAIEAIQAEKQIKGWSRAKKIALIEQDNPYWEDLMDSLPLD